MRTTFVQKARGLFPLLSIAAMTACAGPIGDDEIDGAELLNEGAVGEAQQALVVCGDGVQKDGELCFLPAVMVTNLPAGATAIAAGFMDSDNHLDFVASSSPDDLIRIKLGNGAGGFPGTFTFPMGDGPSGVALADFNGDSRTDVIAAAYNTDHARVRWGGGIPSWASSSAFPVGNGPVRVEAGDLNGDGLDDFVTLDHLGDTLTVRLANTAGGFTPPATFASGANASDVRLADCDGDLDLDLVYTSGSGAAAALRVRMNNGAGAFGPPVVTNLALGPGQFTRSVTLPDLDEDTTLDAVITVNNGTMKRVLGLGGCAFGLPAGASTEPNPARIYHADLDTDGHEDLVIAHSNAMEISIYLGDGAGSVSLPFLMAPGTWVNDLAIGDFNEDGSPDIAFAGSNGGYLLESDP